MKNSYTNTWIILFGLIVGSFNLNAQSSNTFNYTGNVQIFVVPNSGTYEIDTYGASAGNVTTRYRTQGGRGGKTTGTIDLVAGQTLYVYVGGKSADQLGDHPYNQCYFMPGGWNGGGYNRARGNGTAGGGASDVRIGGTSLNNRIIVAGGGGGAGWYVANGGHGGGLSGGASTSSTYYYRFTASGGGTQVSGGAMGSASGSCGKSQGIFGQGGNGSGSSAGGGGGGGGWYGGGGGGYINGGGGGSSYIGGVLNGLAQRGINSGHGKVIITLLGCTEPVAICKDATISLDSNGNATLLTSDVDNGSTADCGLQSITLSKTNFTCDDAGSNTVTLTITDVNGASSSCQATVIVEDNEAPIIEGQNTNLDMNFNTGTGAPVSYTENGITFKSIYGSSSHVHLGDNDRDGSNDIYNHSGCCSTPYRLTVGTGTEFTLKSMNVKSVSGNPTFSVYPTGAVVTINSTGIFTFPAGFEDVTEVRWNQNSGGMVIDDMVVSTKTSGQCPTDITVSSDPGACGTNVSYSANATDNCNASVSFSPSSGSFFNVGTTEVTATATDSSGNTSNCTFDVIVNDNEIPVINGTPMNIVVSTDPGSCDAMVNWTAATVSDNCTGATISSDLNSGDTFPLGVTTVNYTASDANGNDAVATSFTVTVVDNEAPIIEGQNTNLDMNFNTGTGAPVSYTENGITFKSIYGSSSHVHLGDNDRDGSNDIYNHSGCCSTPYRLTVGTGTEFTLKSMNVKSVSGNPTFSVYPTGAVVTINSTGIFTFPAGFEDVTEVRWNQNSGGMVIDDMVVSTKTSGQCPTDITVSSDPGACGTNVSYSANATDNCNASVSFSPSSGSFFNVGTTEVTATATDSSGNTSNCTFDVIVNDNEIPVINGTPMNIVVSTDPGSCDAMVNWTAATVSDNCTGATISSDLNSGDTFPLGVTTVNYTASDANGNDAVATSFTVTVNDTEKPVITCPTDQTVVLDASCGATLPDYTVNVATDNCSVTVTQSPVAGTPYNGDQTISVTLTADDGNGNVVDCSFNVLFDDQTAPTVITQDITVQLDATGNVSITPSDIDNDTTPSNDACGIQSLALDITTFDCNDVGANTVVLTVTDNNNNVSTASATVTVEDNVDPIAIAKDITVQLDASGAASITAADIDNGSNDACGILSLEADNSFTCSDVGPNTVTLTVTDNNNNVSTTTAVITVEDNVDPIAIAKDITVQLDASGAASITAADIDNGSNDACGILSLEADNSFTCSDVGPNTVTLTVTDNNNNVSTTTAVITVEDNVDPIAIAKDITVQLDASGAASITAADIDNGSNDACGILSLEADNSFTCSDVGPNTVTLTVTDNNNNVSTTTAVITVEDNVDPIAIAKDITVQLDASGAASITAADIDNGSNDACGILSLEADNSFTCSDVGPNTVTLTVTDNNNNVSTTTAVITVEDNVDPIAIAKDITVQLDASGAASITAADIDNGSNDACGILSLEADNSFTCSDVGPNTVTLTVTDNNNNVSTTTAVITVEDNVDPIAIAKDITVQLDASGAASITAADIDNGSNDACGILSLEADNSFTCSDVGPNTVTLTVTDNNNNVSTTTAMITVEDNVDPVITCAPNDTVYVDPYQTFYTVDGTEFNATATDACGIDSITYTGGSPSTSGSSMNGVPLNLGTNTMSWTALDVNGNDSNCTTIVEVIKRPTSLIYNGDVVEQYSDSVDLSATLTDDVSPGGGVQGKTITFTIGTQSTTAVTNASGVASTTLILTQDPANTYTVNAEFTEDASYLGSSANENFDITQEDAIVNYIGNEITATQSAYDLTATLDLRVSVQDLADGYRGDIRNATVSFVLDGTEILSPTPISQLVDPYTGVISLSHAVALSNATPETFTLEILIGGYYSASDQSVITVYVPTGEFITGGGHIIPTTSAGTYPSTAGTKTNFGFNVKFNKNGRKLRGKLNFIWRSNGRVYQAKSNATDALSVDITNEEAMTAVFTSKCNYSDITDPLYPISLEGNKIMHVSMTDRGEPGENDDISFTLWDGNELIYSSNWTGVNSIKQVLNGGNLVVHSGAGVGTPTSKAAEPVVEIVVEELFDGLELASWPNPSDDYFNLKLRSKNTVDKIYIQVFDLNNRLVSFRTGVPNRDYKIGATLEAGLYFVTVKQGNATKVVKLIKH